MTAIVGGAFLIYTGKSAGYGLAAIISALTALAAVLIVGRIKQQAELRKKAEALATTT